MMKCYIYKRTNLLDGKSYIGVSVNPTKRFNCHPYSKEFLGRAIRKYGQKNFTKEIILIADEDYCYEYEPKLIELYQTLTPNGYNVSKGGDRPPGMAGRKHSEKTKAQYRLTRKGRPGYFNKNHSAESNEKNRLSHLGENNVRFGKIHSPETIAKMKAKASGKGNPMYGKGPTKGAFKPGETSWNKGIKTSPEVIKKRTETRRQNAILKGKPY